MKCGGGNNQIVKKNQKIIREKQKDQQERQMNIQEGFGENLNTIHQLILDLQGRFDEIRNVPEEDTIKLQELKEIQISWKNQVDKISNDSNMAKIVTAGAGAAGIATGVAVVTLAPTVAMGVATTFGVASTGTAISALSGAAATNAALAWLGGGALAARTVEE